MARILSDVRIKAAYRSIRPKLNTVGTVASNFLLKRQNLRKFEHDQRQPPDCLLWQLHRSETRDEAYSLGG